MHATVKRWGNAYAIRLTKADMERHGLKEGQDVEVQILPPPAKGIDLSRIPTFRSTDGKTFQAIRDEYYDTLPDKWRA